MDPFRATFIVLFIATAALRSYYRIKARGGTQEVVREKWAMLVRIVFGFPYILGVALYIFDPQALKWSSLPIGTAWRWAGAVIFAFSLALLTWVHVTLGENFSSELRIRSQHELVTSGPYRYVRHPMYSAFLLLMIGMGLLSANWLIGAWGLAVAVLIVSLRTHMEEEMMTTAFGERYRQYAAGTGRFLPRLSRPSAQV